MRIGFDVDGVLADFNSAYIERVIESTGRDLFPARPFDIVTWNYPESYGYTDAEIATVWKEIVASPKFWVSLNPYSALKDVRERIGHLAHSTGDDVYFITSRPGSTAKWQTEVWLQSYFGISNPTVLLSSEKGECAHALKLDAYLDDRTENVEDVVAKSGLTATYMLVQPWNTPVNGGRCISHVREFLDAIGR